MGKSYPTVDPEVSVDKCPLCGGSLQRNRTETAAGEVLRGKRCGSCSHGWLK